MNNKYKKYLISLIYILPFLTFLFLFYVLPFFITFKNSFLFSKNQFKQVDFELSIENFKLILNDSNFKSAFLNSNFIVFFGLPISIIISLFFAFLINSLISKFFKKFFLNIIYSQFFISIFAIGIAFSLFFGEKNVFLKLFNTNLNILKNDINYKIYILFFSVWRTLSFNIVFLSFVFSYTENKYKKQIILDNLKFKDKFINLYFIENKKTFFIILYSNITFLFLVYLGAILDNDSDVLKISGHTFSSYILNFLNPLDHSINFNYNKAYAASIIIIIYLFFIIIVFFILSFLIKIIYKKISRKIWLKKFL